MELASKMFRENDVYSGKKISTFGSMFVEVCLKKRRKGAFNRQSVLGCKNFGI